MPKIKAFTKDYSRLFLSVLFALIPSIVAAQGPSPNGSYGFLATAWTNNAVDNTGAAVVGLMNLDGSGNASGTYTLQLGADPGRTQQTVTGSFTGTYSSNSDGTGSIALTFDAGFGLTFATVITDGGQGIQLLSTDGNGDATNLGGGAMPLQGSPVALNGAIPASIIFGNATGNIPLSLSGVGNNGTFIYTAKNGNASGTTQCSDGTTGNWTASVTAFSAIVSLNNPPPGGGGNASGDYLMALSIQSCSDTNGFIRTMSGSITGNFPATGNANLLLHGSGTLVNGIARAGQVSSLSGSYGFRVDSSPVPAGTIGVMNFDGAGGLTLSFSNVGFLGTSLQLPVGSNTGTGTYTVNPDGTGTLALINSNGQPGPTFSFVITDGGSQILLLRTASITASSVLFGTARLQ